MYEKGNEETPAPFYEVTRKIADENVWLRFDHQDLRRMISASKASGDNCFNAKKKRN